MSQGATRSDDATESAESKTQASGSSFYLAMRILPKPQRQAMYEIYAFCRAVDDIADDGGPRPARAAALSAWHRDIDALYAGGPIAPHLSGLATAVAAFALERADFHAVIDGMEMDVERNIQAPSFETLDLYCDRVASAVGRLSVKIFGTPPHAGPDLAHHLGRALQLTNILRDIDEDAAIERLYLPHEALQAAGIEATTPAAVLAHGDLSAVCAPVVAKARGHFEAAQAIMARCPRASVRAARIMGEAYVTILDGLVTRGFAPPRTRVRLSRPKLILAVLRFGLV